MNIILSCLPISILIWSFIKEMNFLIIFILILICKQIFLNFFIQSENEKKKFFFLKEPLNPTCFAKVSIDLEKIDKKINKYNKEKKSKISYSHIALKSIGEALKNNNRLNGFFSFKNFITNKKINVNLPIDYKGEDMTVTKVFNCGKENIRELSLQTKNIKEIISKTEIKKIKGDKVITFLPTYIINLFMKIFFSIYFDLYFFDIFKLGKDKKSNSIVTNMVKFNLKDGIACHAGVARTSIIMVLNAPEKIPTKENGKIIIKKYVSFSITSDFRLGNGEDFLKAVSDIKKVWLSFENYF